MFTGGLIANGIRGMMCSSGGSYRDESLTVTENGIYTPANDVRWSAVNVNVPQSGTSAIIDAVVATPVISTLDIGSGFVVKTHLGQIPSIAPREETYSYSTTGGVFLTVYEKYSYDCFLVIYRGGQPILASRSDVFRNSTMRDVWSYRTEADNTTTLRQTNIVVKNSITVTAPLELKMYNYADNSPRFTSAFSYQVITTYYPNGNTNTNTYSFSLDCYPMIPTYNIGGNFIALSDSQYHDFALSFQIACATYAGLIS